MTGTHNNKERLVTFYSERIKGLSSKIAELKQRNRIYVVSELITFCMAVAAFAFYCVKDFQPWFVCAAAVSLVAYACIRRADLCNGERTERLRRRRAVYARELKYLEGDFSCFDDGKRYSDPRHPFSFDLDIYGKESLFNRMDRTVTTGGSDMLASMLGLLLPDREHITRRREAIDELALNEEWRTEFLAAGQHMSPDGLQSGEKTDSAAVLNVADKVRSMDVAPFAGQTWALSTAAFAITGLLTTIILSAVTPLPASIPVMWGTINLFGVLTVTSGPLRRISRAVGRLHSQMQHYTDFIRIIDGAEFKAKELNEIQNSLRGDGSGGLEAFIQLSGILKSIDRRSNILGLIAFNVFGLSDFFLVRKFLKWQKTYMEGMGGKIDCVSRMDALVSMAVFRFNEPEAATAEVSDADRIEYDARGLYHPFLGKTAVRNDFRVRDGSFYIVTGANMAGKSTFLRSVGINCILAMNGLPVFATSLRISVFNLFTGMRTTDDLTRGISYFNAELLRLQQLLENCASARHSLIILDEILKGTNSLDKLNGSRLFLERISLLPVTGIIATHDLELSRLEEEYPERFHNLCFEIGIADNITYTYKLTPGVARNQNATYLLKRILDGADIKPRDTSDKAAGVSCAEP